MLAPRHLTALNGEHVHVLGARWIAEERIVCENDDDVRLGDGIGEATWQDQADG